MKFGNFGHEKSWKSLWNVNAGKLWEPCDTRSRNVSVEQHKLQLYPLSHAVQIDLKTFPENFTCWQPAVNMYSSPYIYGTHIHSPYFEHCIHTYIHQGYFYQISKRGHLRFWTFFGKFWTFKKIVDLQYAAGFRGPGILIKRSTIADLSVYAAWLRGPDISHPKKGLKKYSKIDCRAFATSRDIPNFGPFWVVKIQWGAMPPWPPDKNIPVHTYIHTYIHVHTL